MVGKFSKKRGQLQVADTKQHFDVIIIGAGPGGLEAAQIIARANLHVAIIEADKLGGECPNYGCVPAKSLIHSAKAITNFTDATKSGIIYAPTAESSFPKAQYLATKAISRINSNEDSEAKLQALGVTIIKGRGYIIDQARVAVGEQIFSYNYLVIATGGALALPNIIGLESINFKTSKDIFNSPDLPSSVAIIGAGAVGIELAYILSAFGSKVLLLESAPRILYAEEPEVSSSAFTNLKQCGVHIEQAVKIRQVKRIGTKSKSIEIISGGTSRRIIAEEVLIATGKRLNTTDGIDNLGIETNKKFIVVDKYLRTSQSHIYAIGDVAGPYQYTHTAIYQARIAANSIINNNKRSKLPSANYNAVPRVIFGNLEYASIGLPTSVLTKNRIAFQSNIYYFKQLHRAQINNEQDSVSFVKIWINPSSRKIYGAAIVASEAGSLIGQLALIMQTGLTIDHLASSLHAYPTFSEALQAVAALFSLRN